MKLPEHLVSYLSYLVLGLVLGGCASEALTDCSLVDCAVDESVYLEIFSNGENLLGNQTYSLSQITITSSETSTTEITLYSNIPSGLNSILLLYDRNWKEGNYTYSINLGDDWIIPLNLEFEISKGDCCGGLVGITALSSSKFTIEKQPGGFYRIVLE